MQGTGGKTLNTKKKTIKIVLTKFRNKTEFSEEGIQMGKKYFKICHQPSGKEN